VGERTLKNVIEELKAIAGLGDDPRIKPHSIRQAAATWMLRNGADIKSIQAFLGHSPLQTTAVYLHFTEEQLRKTIGAVGLGHDDRGVGPRSPSVRTSTTRHLRFAPSRP